MQNERISLHQMMALLFAALLSPMVTLLPPAAAAAAGGAAWLSSLAALPVLLAVCWMIRAIFRRLPPEAGLAEAFRAAFGATAGRLLTGACLLWGLFLLTGSARLYAERLLSSGYRKASLAVFLAALLGAALWLGLGGLSAFARTGEIFCLILAAVLCVVLPLALFNIEIKYVLPVWSGDVPGVVSGALPVLKSVSWAVFAGFLGGRISRRPDDVSRSVKWTVVFCLVLSLLLLAVVGQLGPDLTAALKAPFFQMVAGVGIRGAFQRLEAAVSALWALSNLALLGLLLFACRAMSASLFQTEKDRRAVLPAAALAFAGALTLFPTPLTAETAVEIGEFGAAILLFGLLPLVLLLLTRKSRGRGKGTGCGRRDEEGVYIEEEENLEK